MSKEEGFAAAAQAGETPAKDTGLRCCACHERVMSDQRVRAVFDGKITELTADRSARVGSMWFNGGLFHDACTPEEIGGPASARREPDERSEEATKNDRGGAHA